MNYQHPTTGPRGLENAASEINALLKQINLIALAAEHGDQMDNRILPAINASADSVADRLGDIVVRLDALTREWIDEDRVYGTRRSACVASSSN